MSNGNTCNFCKAGDILKSNLVADWMFYSLLVFLFCFPKLRERKKINLPFQTCTPFQTQLSSCRACWGVPEAPEPAQGKSPTQLSSELKLGLHSLFTVQLQTLKRLISSHKCRFLLKIGRQHSRPRELQQGGGGGISSSVSGEGAQGAHSTAAQLSTLGLCISALL